MRKAKPEMNCIRTDNGGESRLVIDGSLDALTVRDLRPIIDAVVADRPQRVTVDIEKLELIDSSGVGAIVSLFKRVKANGGSVVVVGAREQPLAVLKLLKLDAVLGVT
jgi:anti-sigma B factor antagonist